MEREELHGFVTVPRAARRLGVGSRQLRRAIEAGHLPVYQIGGWPRLAWSDLFAWIEKQRRGTAALCALTRSGWP